MERLWWSRMPEGAQCGNLLWVKGVKENDVFYFKDMKEKELELTRAERSAMAKKQAIAMKKRRADGRPAVAAVGISLGKSAPAQTITDEPEAGSPNEGEALARTFSSDVYTKMLQNPRLTSTQRAKLEEMRSRRAQKEQKAAAAQELDAWLDKTPQRRELASSRKELDLLKALKQVGEEADNDETGASLSAQAHLVRSSSAAERDSKSELQRLQGASLEEEKSATLAQIAKLKTELGLA